MRFRDTPPAHLTYCLNVHPGESWAETLSAIRTHTLPIRNLVCPALPFGLGLRLSHLAALSLEAPGQLDDFRRFLHDHRLYVFTLNGFPYGPFHGAPVKTTVYAPDWRTPERLAYTLRLARLLASLLPEGVDGSISTVPLTYRAWHNGPADDLLLARNLADTALTLHRLHRNTGREIHLGLEPEPDCLLATPDDVIRFFETALLPLGIPHLTGMSGCSRPEAEALLRRHIGICLDTCHMAVEFLSPAECLTRLLDAGIRISKIQLSAAIETNASPAALARLRDFCDPVYLHQTRIRDATNTPIRRYPDLAPALAAEHPNDHTLWRTHFHVPLHTPETATLRSTAGLLDRSFWRTALQSAVSHYEIESYTFSVLPIPLQAEGIGQSVAKEFAWTLLRA
jgi:sugar phosphate isomerase/epimerase